MNTRMIFARAIVGTGLISRRGAEEFLDRIYKIYRIKKETEE